MSIIHSEDGIPPAKAKRRRFGGTFNDVIGIGATHTETFTPPKGKIWSLLGMVLDKGAPVGAASGTHSFGVGVDGDNTVWGRSLFGDGINWHTSSWANASDKERPADRGAAATSLTRLYADNDSPLVVTYDNFTDVINDKTGEITIWVLEESL